MSRDIKNIKGIVIFIGILVIIISSIGLLKLKDNNDDNDILLKSIINDEDTSTINISKKEKEISITSVGNILFHDKQIEGAKTLEGYDFTPSFQYIKEAISKSDLSIGVLEGTLTKSEDYSGYPCFKSPYEVIDALKNTGLDIINYASNHILDGGEEGLFNTLEITKEKGIDVLGIRELKDDKRYIIKEVHGKRIAFLSYVYESDSINGEPTINTIKIPNNLIDLINTFNYEKLDDFYENVKIDISDVKSEGADFIILSIHWGEEYESNENTIQKDIANTLSELGVNIILGSHPHVIQPYETIVNSRGEKTFVVYSQGNFLSNQCYEEIQDYRTEDGLLINFILGYNDNSIYLKEYEVVPTWVFREEKDGAYSHKVIPLDKDIATFSKGELNEEFINGAAQSLERTMEVIKDWTAGKTEF